MKDLNDSRPKYPETQRFASKYRKKQKILLHIMKKPFSLSFCAKTDVEKSTQSLRPFLAAYRPLNSANEEPFSNPRPIRRFLHTLNDGHFLLIATDLITTKKEDVRKNAKKGRIASKFMIISYG